MNYERHLALKGTHAFLSPSQPYWLRYSDEKIVDRWNAAQAATLGTLLHEQAARDIELRLRRPRTTKTFDAYVNDAIGFRMLPEQVLYYSDNFYGTCDAHVFDSRHNLLRIHDLKTGSTPAHMEQLYIYAALYCLEHNIKPGDINFECRLYQNDSVEIKNPTAEDILPIMDEGVRKSKLIDKLREEGV